MGSAELVYWMAEFKLRAEDEEEAYEAARAEAEQKRAPASPGMQPGMSPF